MKSLLLLNASENKIKSLPKLPKGKLDRLYVGNNCLKNIDINNLLSSNTLTEVLLQNNLLEVIGNEIFLLRSLKVFDVSNNYLTNLPHVLGYMSSLQKILVEGIK